MIRLQNVLRMSSRRICETSWRCLGKMSWKRLDDVFARRLENVLKTSCRCLEDVWIRRIYWSWPRHLEDVFWRRMINKNIFVFIKMSWRRKRKTSLRRLHQDECLLGVNTIILNKNTDTVILLEKITVEKSSLKNNKRRTR